MAITTPTKIAPPPMRDMTSGRIGITIPNPTRSMNTISNNTAVFLSTAFNYIEIKLTLI
jgi:hypothetical protein